MYDEGPELFQAWVMRRRGQGDLTAQAISRRLLFMPIGARRATVNAMMGSDFWMGIGGPEANRRALLGTIEKGLVDALAKAPSAGDLWLAASNIRSQTVGFDKQAENYLSASYLMAPREAGIIRSRIVFAASVEPMLRMPLTAERERDMNIARKLFPGFESQFRLWLDAKDKKKTGARRKFRSGVR